MVVVNKLPMKYDTIDKKSKVTYNRSFINALQDYSKNVGYVFTYDEKRKSDYEYRNGDIVGQMGDTIYLTLDKEIEFLLEITNENYSFISNLHCPYIYVLPIITTIKQYDGSIQVKEVSGLELLI